MAWGFDSPGGHQRIDEQAGPPRPIIHVAALSRRGGRGDQGDAAGDGGAEVTQDRHGDLSHPSRVSATAGCFWRTEDGMTVIIDLKARFGALKMLEGRTPTSSEADRTGAFTTLAPYRDGAVFAAKFAGTSAWERHPQGDEIVQVVDGATTLHLMTAEGKQSVTLRAGMMVVVPQNTWH